MELTFRSESLVPWSQVCCHGVSHQFFAAGEQRGVGMRIQPDIATATGAKWRLQPTEDASSRRRVKLSIVIPIYNGSETIETILNDIKAEFDGVRYELILVNDG